MLSRLLYSFVLQLEKFRMAKKGGVQQLQTEINTNDELTKFLDRDGLIGLKLHYF